VRCDISCGCRKNKNNKKLKAKEIERKSLANRLVKVDKNKKDKKEKLIRRDLADKKLKSCRGCPYSKQTKKERQSKTRICHKNNISIQSILNNKKSNCPIGNF